MLTIIDYKRKTIYFTDQEGLLKYMDLRKKKGGEIGKNNCFLEIILKYVKEKKNEKKHCIIFSFDYGV